MAHQIRCKRIIDGKTYNTETSTLLGEDRFDLPNSEEMLSTNMLFKTRHGAYFLYFYNPHEPEEHVHPLEPSEAQSWMEKNCSAEELEAEFGQMPDAGDNEARFTLRIPESLRKRVALIAEANNQSLNAWVLRCLENCASSQERRVP